MGPLQVMSKITSWVLNSTLVHAAAVVTTSSELAESLRGRFRENGRDREVPVFTIRNVFPVATPFRRVAVPDREDGTFRVLYAGTIGRAQDLGNAVEAVRICVRRGMPIRLRLVGNGAAKRELRAASQDLREFIEFHSRRHADVLDDDYQWADTALVHLADWEPLTRTVPSKLYELAEVGVHISGVVQGEAADLITSLEAGSVVQPGEPEQLADLWCSLASDRSQLNVGGRAGMWVLGQRERVTPETLRRILKACRVDHTTG